MKISFEVDCERLQASSADARACFDQSEVRLHQRLARGRSIRSRTRTGLLGELVRRRRSGRAPAASGRRATRAWPGTRGSAPGCPRRLAPPPSASSSSSIARARSISPRRISSRRAGSRGLARYSSARPEPLLDLDAPLEQARRDLARPRLRLRHPRDRRGEQRRDRRPARPSRAPRARRQRRARRSAASRWLHVRKARIRARAGVVAARLGQRLVAERDQRRGVSALNVEASAKSTSARSTPGGTSASSCSSSVGRSLADRRRGRWKFAARKPPLPCRGGIAGRQLGGELAELGRGRGRPARGRLLGRGVQLGRRRRRRARRRRARGGGPAPRRP